MVNGDVDQHGAFLHALDHVLAHQLRGRRARHEDGADDQVGVEKLGLQRGRVGDQGAHAALVLVVEALQDVRVKVEHRDLRAQAVRHGHRRRTNLAAADDHHARRLRARHAGDQQATPALGGQQVVGALNHGEAAGHLGHRGQKRQGAAGIGDGLIGHSRGAGFHESVRQRAVRRQVQVGKQQQVLAQVAILSLQRLLDLDHHVRRPGLLGGGNDGGAGGLILGVREGSTCAGTSFDEDLVAVVDKRANRRRGESYAVLVVHDFFGCRNAHVQTPLGEENSVLRG